MEIEREIAHSSRALAEGHLPRKPGTREEGEERRGEVMDKEEKRRNDGRGVERTLKRSAVFVGIRRHAP